MARQSDSGTNVEYVTDLGGTIENTRILKVWGSRIRALESAVDAGNKVVFVQYGETLEDALARDLAAKPKPASSAAPRAPKVIATELP